MGVELFLVRVGEKVQPAGERRKRRQGRTEMDEQTVPACLRAHALD